MKIVGQTIASLGSPMWAVAIFIPRSNGRRSGRPARVRFARASPGRARTVRLSLGGDRNVRYFGGIQRIVTRFGTEGSEVQILSPRPTSPENIGDS
jgi:hypothetical protein